MSRGPSPHLTWAELACHDPQRTPYPIAYRTDQTRAPRLAAAFEAVRSEIGDLPLLITSAYRTPAWNRQVGGKPQSQHLEGRALDLAPVRGLTVEELYQAVVKLASVTRYDGTLAIRGIGHYSRWVHLDVRPTARLARWEGT